MGYTTALGHTPQFLISKDGTDITSAIANRIVSIRVESREGGGEADVVDIVVDDRDWNLSLPSLGQGSATLSVALGYTETGLSAMGTFHVDDVTLEWPPKQLRIHGNSVSMSSNVKLPLTQSFDNQTLGDIICNIAGAAGVSPKVDPSLASIQIPYLNQTCSSMHLLQYLERNFNGLAKFSDGYLSFTKRGSGNSASGQSIENFTLSAGDIGPVGNDIKLGDDFAYSAVKAGWWDGVNNQVQWVTSSVAGSPNGSEPFTIRAIHGSQVEAQSMADSMMAQANRRTKEGSLILAKGAPAIRGGQGFAIAGCRDGIDGTSYLVKRAVHSFTKDAGIVTTLDVYDEGGNVDFSSESTGNADLDFSAIPATVLPANGIGHM